MKERDADIIKHITSYCNDIAESISRFGNTLEDLMSDKDYKYSVSLAVFQITELTTMLSDEFTSEHSSEPWREMRGMRKFFAHKYGKLDVEILYNTITKKIPELLVFCNKVLGE